MRHPLTIGIIIGVVGLLLVGVLFAPAPLLPVVLAAERLAYIPTPFGPFPLTNTVVASWVTILFWIIFGFVITRNMTLVPRGAQNFIEAVIEWAIGQIENFGGKQNVKKFFPLVMTIFLMIVTSNWFGLLPGFTTIGIVHTAPPGTVLTPEQLALEIPIVQGTEGFAFIPLWGKLEPVHHDESHGPAGPPRNGEVFMAEFLPIFRSANTDLNMTLALALVAFFTIQFWGIQANGLRYFSKFINIDFSKGIFMGFVNFLLGLIEILSEVARIVSFAFRLFGNVFAGEVLLMVMIFLLPWGLVVPFYSLELFVGFIQAGVFAILTMSFGRQAMEHHGDSHEHHGAEHAPQAAHH